MSFFSFVPVFVVRIAQAASFWADLSFSSSFICQSISLSRAFFHLSFQFRSFCQCYYNAIPFPPTGFLKGSVLQPSPFPRFSFFAFEGCPLDQSWFSIFVGFLSFLPPRSPFVVKKGQLSSLASLLRCQSSPLWYVRSSISLTKVCGRCSFPHTSILSVCLAPSVASLLCLCSVSLACGCHQQRP